MLRLLDTVSCWEKSSHLKVALAQAAFVTLSEGCQLMVLAADYLQCPWQRPFKEPKNKKTLTQFK